MKTNEIVDLLLTLSENGKRNVILEFNAQTPRIELDELNIMMKRLLPGYFVWIEPGLGLLFHQARKKPKADWRLRCARQKIP